MAKIKKDPSEVKEQTLTKKGILLDVTYEDTETDSIIQLFITNKEERYFVSDKNFHPYLYLSCEKSDTKKRIELLQNFSFGTEQKFKALKVEETSSKINEKAVLKVSFRKVSELVSSREYFNSLGFEKFEYDIPFSKRYLIDKQLEPCNGVEVVIDSDNNLINVKKVDTNFDTRIVSYDLETMMGQKFEIGAEPILFYSAVWNEKDKKEKYKGKIVSYEIPEIKGIKVLENEKELIEELNNDLKDTDIIVTYNGDNFDFSYTKVRAKKLKANFLINGKEVRVTRSGLDNAARLHGVQHFDSFQVIQFLQRTGAINSPKLDIETVSEKVFGIKKEKVYPGEINEAWISKDEEKIERVAEYNLEDSETALKICEEFLPLFIEISKLTSQTLFDSTRSSTGNMVEDLLLKEAHLREMIAPNKPREGEVNERTMNPIKGAFVKEPIPGLHEDIAVLDFASLYPTIIISHNISPETLSCKHTECKKENSSPDGTWFCKKEKGMFPEILGTMLKKRLTFKKEYKEKKKKGIDDRTLFAKQWALKIILNSVYGYLGYPRARWYSRECASAVTAFEREYIQKSLETAEKEGFSALYSDTDSAFLLMKGKTKKDVEDFTEKINKSLPEDMELEIDGFYKRGIFVTKKEGGAAKKRYALIDDKGNLKIVGFEYVRRDWCTIAKETQKKVLELVLSEGKEQEAVKFVKKVLKDLKDGKVQKKDLAIMTMLQRKPQDYDSIGPHVAAAKKAIERGKEIGVGSMLSFIVTKPKKDKATISDKAELEEYVKEGDYDANYYIDNQVMPAVIKIMRELGYDEQDLLGEGKQTGLGNWS